ncbi:hypothetical protein A8B83_09345 [Rhodobacteraceae bacterium EhC02]|nr:hypothetical protein A8B83_09345 [Rhodobacteraceae bacterium EhC02]
MMKKMLMAAALAGMLAPVAVVITPGAAMAGPIDRACMSSDRKARSARLCSCIQQVADQTLSRSDQRIAAKFFRDPQKAQDIRQSDSQNHETFWRKYRAFGETAAAMCS